MDDAKQCPWCQRWCLKDNACNYIFACGLPSSGNFMVGSGCGRSWCWGCGLKFCGQYYDPKSGVRCIDAKDSHNKACCRLELGFNQTEYCGGGCSSHCNKRW